MNLISDIDSFFNGLGSSISNDAAKAAADVVKKTIATAHVAAHLAEVFAKDVENGWHTLDNTPVATLVENAIAQLKAGNIEKAALNIVYLVYQNSIEETSKVVSLVESVAKSPGGIINTLENDVKAAVGKVEGFFGFVPSPAPAPATIPTLTDVFSGVTSTATPIAPVAVSPTPSPAPTPAPSVVTPAKPQLAG